MSSNMKKLGVEKKRAKEHIRKMLEYRRGLYELIERKKKAFLDDYELQQWKRWASEESELERLKEDEIAEQAMEILQKESDNPD